MGFGQSPGPPATHRQLQQLTELLHAAGHEDFRDARGPLGLNQRQAGGRFTRDEADELIGRLEAEAGDGSPMPSVARLRAPGARATALAAALRGAPDDVLAEELQRRGWVVMEP